MLHIRYIDIMQGLSRVLSTVGFNVTVCVNEIPVLLYIVDMRVGSWMSPNSFRKRMKGFLMSPNELLRTEWYARSPMAVALQIIHVSTRSTCMCDLI